MRYFFIMNRLSNGGKSKHRIKKILALLNEAKVNYEYILIDTLEEAYNQSIEANKNGFDRIIAVGGDGTINNVINGFYNNEGRLNSKAHFGVVYTGTSPDFCKTYSIPTDVDKAVKFVLSAEVHKISIGRLECSVNDTNDNNINTVRYFACCANIGIGASIARKANGGIRKYMGDFLGTFISTILCVIKYTPSNQYAVIDGKEREFKNNINLSIGITKYIASGIKINHNLSNYPNSLYCLEAKGFKFSNIISTLKKLYSGKRIEESSTLKLSYLQQIHIAKNKLNNEIEMDGDPVGILPCSINRAIDELPLIH